MKSSLVKADLTELKASEKDVEEWEAERLGLERIKTFSDKLLRKPYFENTAHIFDQAVKNMEEFYQDAFWALLNTVEFSFNH